MSDMQTIMKFEYLPNEVLIECFEYLNAIDIFHSFDFLNYRFYKLIRNIPLCLNTEGITKSIFAQFCIKILLNPQIKNQIVALKLSDKSAVGTSKILFSFFSLNEFSQLRSLSLIHLAYRTYKQISGMLPLLTNLHHFRFADSSGNVNEILTSLLASNIQTLSLETLNFDLKLPNPFTSVVCVIISRSSMEDLFHLLKHTPTLQYLSIGHVWLDYGTKTVDELRLINEHAVYLKQLVINNFTGGFELLEILFQRTPNLKLLMISATDDIEIIDACRWQRLITVSLPFLDIFKFIFRFKLENDDSDISDRFQHFQTEFWHQQHHWYTGWTVHHSESVIYTVPYMLDKYVLTATANRFCDTSISAFKNVTDLTVFIEALTDICQYHFPNVKSLKLDNKYIGEHDTYPFLKTKHILCLKSIVNMRNLTHLDISSNCRMKSPSVLLYLLQEAPYVSSLRINKDTLFSFLNNGELCKYLNKMIKKLDIVDRYHKFLDSHQIVKLCEVFCNIEQLQCNVGRRNNLLLILNELSKLSHMKSFSYETIYMDHWNHWLERFLPPPLDFYSFEIQRNGGRYVLNEDSSDDYDSDDYNW